jgi:bifunctional non-homologous end joining protein LigD
VKSRSAASARLPDFVEPMKAKLVDSMPPGNWIYEIKFDGYRALALRGDSERGSTIIRTKTYAN